MMIGCDKLFVALFTHHIALKDVPKKIKTKKLINFMINLYNEIKEKKIGVLALNPHAGDNGVMGDEEKKIKKAIKKANDLLLEEVFIGPLVPDTAFTSQMREKIKYFVCMYHDQGLIPTKTLYFEEGINVSLNLPIIRTSVDHGTAYDIAYKNKKPSNTSYINAIKEALKLSVKKGHYKI
jgi:4-hydroxythreonine-4-phosphate dehydrogenase